MGAALLGTADSKNRSREEREPGGSGPGSEYIPRVSAAFVRRREEYGMRWPGQIYDGQSALANYRRRIGAEAGRLGIQLTLRPEPLYSLEETANWIRQAQAEKADGLFVILLDRQEHAWPSAEKGVECGIPTVVYSPVGTSFTTNTVRLAHRNGVFIASTDDFSQAVYGLNMLRAGAKLREMRYVVLKGEDRREDRINGFGTKLQYVPASDFLDEYNRTAVTEEIMGIADDYLSHATSIFGASRQDVVNGVKSFAVARSILRREGCDGISMDCLGALGKSTVSLPCIAWSRMNDMGIPAACEADLRACVTHALVQQLFDRPGFQQDPVPDTARQTLIGSHCCCPTKLNGFQNTPEPYAISHHHGMRDAVPKTAWRVGQRITVVDVFLDKPEVEMLISAGEVVDNVAVPPSGGCVVAPMVKLDGVDDLLDYPGFHQVFIYGDYKRELRQYCGLFGIKPLVV